MTVRLVVYGLLRRGYSMAPLLAGARFLGRVELAGFDLFDLGHCPAAAPGAGTLVGELYELPGPDTLVRLDAGERVHETPPLYRRVPVVVEGRSAWLYLFARDTAALPRIESGDWAAVSPPGEADR